MRLFQVGDPVRFHDGQRGHVAKVINGGTLYLFESPSTGARFTVRADEIGDAPTAPPPLERAECRVIYRMEAQVSNLKTRQRTPAQQQQAQHCPDEPYEDAVSKKLDEMTDEEWSRAVGKPIRCGECDRVLIAGVLGANDICAECAEKEKAPSVPYPEFCYHPAKCAGRSSCQRDPNCID